MQRELDATRQVIDQQQEEIDELYTLQDHLEQYTRKNSLEIHGIPESAYTSTEEVVLKVANALDVAVSSQVNIEIFHKLNTKGSRPIIVKFISHKIKSNLYRARAKLKGIKVSDIFQGLGYSASVESEKISLNENLTTYRRKIMSKANEKRLNGELLSIWSMDGKIYVKTLGRPIRINEIGDLDF